MRQASRELPETSGGRTPRRTPRSARRAIGTPRDGNGGSCDDGSSDSYLFDRATSSAVARSLESPFGETYVPRHEKLSTRASMPMASKHKRLAELHTSSYRSGHELFDRGRHADGSSVFLSSRPRAAPPEDPFATVSLLPNRALVERTPGNGGQAMNSKSSRFGPADKSVLGSGIGPGSYNTHYGSMAHKLSRSLERMSRAGAGFGTKGAARELLQVSKDQMDLPGPGAYKETYIQWKYRVRTQAVERSPAGMGPDCPRSEADPMSSRASSSSSLCRTHSRRTPRRHSSQPP